MYLRRCRSCLSTSYLSCLLKLSTAPSTIHKKIKQNIDSRFRFTKSLFTAGQNCTSFHKLPHINFTSTTYLTTTLPTLNNIILLHVTMSPIHWGRTPRMPSRKYKRPPITRYTNQGTLHGILVDLSTFLDAKRHSKSAATTL